MVLLKYRDICLDRSQNKNINNTLNAPQMSK
jgi:hypothetical protein